MAKKEIMCCIGVDVDAVAGWLGSYGGEDSPCDITRGLFAGEIGSPACSRCSTDTASAPPGSSPATRSRPFPSRCRWWRMPDTRSVCMATPMRTRWP